MVLMFYGKDVFVIDVRKTIFVHYLGIYSKRVALCLVLERVSLLTHPCQHQCLVVASPQYIFSSYVLCCTRFMSIGQHCLESLQKELTVLPKLCLEKDEDPCVRIHTFIHPSIIHIFTNTLKSI